MKDIWKRYKKIEKISSNQFSNIYKAKIKNNGEYVAIKEINKINLNKEIFTEKIQNMKKLNSENILNLKEIETETEDSVYIISEFCYLNIEEYLKKKKNGILIEEINQILKNI